MEMKRGCFRGEIPRCQARRQPLLWDSSTRVLYSPIASGCHPHHVSIIYYCGYPESFVCLALSRTHPTPFRFFPHLYPALFIPHGPKRRRPRPILKERHNILTMSCLALFALVSSAFVGALSGKETSDPTWGLLGISIRDIVAWRLCSSKFSKLYLDELFLSWTFLVPTVPTS